MKQNNKFKICVAILVTCLFLFLTACGGSDAPATEPPADADSSQTGPAAESPTGTAPESAAAGNVSEHFDAGEKYFNEGN